MPLTFDDLRSAAGPFHPSQAIAIASLAQRAVADMVQDGELAAGVGSVSGLVVNAVSAAAANQAKIQAALNSRGRVIVSDVGVVYYNAPFVFDDDTIFEIGPLTVLRQADNNGGYQFGQNRQWQSIAWAPTSQITTAGTAVGTGRRQRHTVQLPAAAIADLATARYVHIAGDSLDWMNGIWEIESASGTTLTFLCGLMGYAGTTAAPIATLTSAVNAVATTFNISSAAGFPTTNGFWAWVDNEKVLVTAGAGTTTWTVTRGYDLSTAAAHSAGASISTLRFARANANIEINVYGRWDYNMENGNVGVGSQRQQGLYMSRARNFRTRCFRAQGNKSLIHLSNTFYASIQNIDSDHGSDAVHLIGENRHCDIDGVYGNYGDDPVAWLADDTLTGVDVIVPDSFGDLYGLRVANMHTSGTAARQILFGNSRPNGYVGTARGIKIENINANNNHAPAVLINAVTIEDIEISNARWHPAYGEPAGPRAAFVQVGDMTSTLVKSLTINNLHAGQAAGVKVLVNMSSTTGTTRIDKLTINDSRIAFNSQEATGLGILRMNTGCSVGEFVCDNVHTTTVGTQNYGYAWIDRLNGATCDRMTVRGGRIDGYGCIEEAQWNNDIVFDISGLVANARWVLNGYGGYTAYLRDIEVLPGFGGTNSLLNLIDGNGGKDINLYISGIRTYAANKIISNYGTATIKLKMGDSTCAVDITKLNRAGSAGAMCVHNGQTAAGTIVAGNLVVCDATGAANSWKQVSAPANQY